MRHTITAVLSAPQAAGAQASEWQQAQKVILASQQRMLSWQESLKQSTSEQETFTDPW